MENVEAVVAHLVYNNFEETFSAFLVKHSPLGDYSWKEDNDLIRDSLGKVADYIDTLTEVEILRFLADGLSFRKVQKDLLAGSIAKVSCPRGLNKPRPPREEYSKIELIKIKLDNVQKLLDYFKMKLNGSTFEFHVESDKEFKTILKLAEEHVWCGKKITLSSAIRPDLVCKMQKASRGFKVEVEEIAAIHGTAATTTDVGDNFALSDGQLETSADF